MSLNQSRVEKSEAQLRRPGRSGNSGHNRVVSGGGKGGGGGGSGSGSGHVHPPLSTPAAPASSSVTPSLSTNRSLKKSGNGHGGGQSRVNYAVVANHAVQNGARAEDPLHGSSDALEPSGAKSVDTSITRNSNALPKGPSSQPAPGASDSTAPKTPPKGDASRSFTLQFGTISPGIMNGMQIPARTSSAPPNLDEQKHDQARHDSFRAVPTLPLPAAQKQQQRQTRKDVGITQSNTVESHPPTQRKREMEVPVPSVPIVKSSVLPIGGMPIPMPFQQPQVPLQFGGPNPQMQSQSIAPNSLQMTMAQMTMAQMTNAHQVPQQMFIPSIHTHQLQTQAMMHQGQGLGFTPQMGHQLNPQLNNNGFGIASQFPQQQTGKFGGPRKTPPVTVRITHPDTHKPVKLDGTDSSGQRPLPNVNPQSQPIPTFTSSHQINYYPSLQPNSYNPPSMYFPTTTHALPSTQMTAGPQAPRYGYPVSQGGQAISFMPSSRLGPPPPLHSISEAVSLEGLPVSVPSTHPVQVTVKPPVGSFAEKVVTPVTVTNAMPNSKAEPAVDSCMLISKAEEPKLLKPSGDTTSSQQQRDREIGPDSSFQQHKSANEPSDNISLPVSDQHTSTVTPVLLSQMAQSGTSLSAPVTPVGDSGPLTAGTDCKSREPIQRSESLKEHQKRPSKKDFRHSRQQNQTDASDPAVATKLASSKIVKDSSAAVVISRQVSIKSDNIQSLPEPDLSFSTMISPSSIVEHSVPSKYETSEIIEGQAINIASGSSGVVLKKEASQDGSQCSSELATNEASMKERGPSETSTSLGPEGDGTISNYSDSSFCPAETSLVEFGQNRELMAAAEYGETEVPNDSSLDSSNTKVYPVSTGTESSLDKQEDARVEKSEITIVCDLNNSEKKQHDASKEAAGINSEVGRTAKESIMSADNGVEDEHSPPNALANQSEVVRGQDVGLTDPGISPLETAPLSTSILVEETQKPEGKVTELSSTVPVFHVLSEPKDRSSLEPTRTNKTTAAKKKKRREILSKADAAETSDLYNAYKGPEEKQEVTFTLDSTDSSLTVDAKDVPVDAPDKDAVVGDEDGQNKAELDDWEDAADISSPKLTSENGQLIHGNEATNRKKYSRDFLLTFSEKCTVLPVNFEIGFDLNALMSVPVGTSRVVDREPYPSPGRGPSGTLRGDRRTAGIHGSFGPGGELHQMDSGHGAAGMSFRPGQGVNHGVLRNPRGQQSNQFVGGILSGPMQPPASQGGVLRNNADADRWQRAAGFQRGLISSPQTPLQVMHKAERKYEVGKVSDEEVAKQRQLKGILNKLTPQNFDKLFAQVQEVNIDNATTLTGVISQIFDKALMEPTFCEMYADFCFHLAGALPDFSEDNEKITFRRLLLNKCQEEFERGEREQAEANRDEEEGEMKQSKAEREEKRVQVRRRMLGNIRLIGELYKQKMLTERIMHECIKKLLGQYQNPDEEDIEALCKLMSTIGEMIDHPKAKEHMDAYFDMMQKLSTNQKLSSRVRFLLRDSIDLRKNRWQQRRKVEGPKKIVDVHKDAAQERQTQSSRLARGPVISSAPRRGPPVDYGHRGSTGLTSPSSQQIGGIRNLPSHARGHAQDFRLEARHQFESRTLSVPLTQRPIEDNYITLGPQGGLAKGMSIRGQPLISNVPSTEIGDPRRLASGPNGYGSREEIMMRSMPDKFPGDRVSDRTITAPTAGQIHGPLSGSQAAPSGAMTLSEVGLQEKSISAIREFYSAKDEEEITTCIKELNSPNFYPSMVSLWVTDSFERKDMERDLLARLLVNLCKSHSSLLTHIQLIQGFQSVLSSLEDAVNDAPKAAEFLGRIFAEAVLENVVSLREIGRLIQEGGEEPGRLLEVGLASRVLGSTLEFIRSERGDSVLDEIRTSSNLRLEDFRALQPIRSKKLDAFL